MLGAICFSSVGFANTEVDLPKIEKETIEAVCSVDMSLESVSEDDLVLEFCQMVDLENKFESLVFEKETICFYELPYMHPDYGSLILIEGKGILVQDFILDNKPIETNNFNKEKTKIKTDYIYKVLDYTARDKIRCSTL